MRSRKELADAIRILSMDAVDKAKSGHPGAPMGMADMAEALWRGVLRHNPADPHWANRPVKRPSLHAALQRAASHRL